MPKQVPITLRRIAAECRMSVSTVSKILRNEYKVKSSKGTRKVEVVTKLAQRLGYIANGPARRLRSGRNYAIAIVVPVDPFGYPEYITFEFINGIAAAIASQNYGVSLVQYPRFESEVALKKIADRSVDAVVVLDQSSRPLSDFLQKAIIPAIYVNVDPKHGLPTLHRNEYEAARLIMEVTIGLGYRRFLIAGGWNESSHFSHLQRAAAIADMAAAHPEVTCIYNGIAHWGGGFEKSIADCKPDAETLVLACC